MVLLGVVVGAIALSVRLLLSDGVFRMSVFWWMFFTAVGAFVLTKTKYGNWIFAVGGNKDAARATGVPADKVKTALFMATSLMGAFVGAMILMRLNSVQAQQGDGQEFEYIIAAVVGGNLMTGGYGSVVGASLVALIMAVSKNGIPAAQWNQDGRFIFLGAVLLVAVLVNNYVRKKANEQR
jgi:simple sugar transport system permease protein